MATDGRPDGLGIDVFRGIGSVVHAGRAMSASADYFVARTLLRRSDSRQGQAEPPVLRTGVVADSGITTLSLWPSAQAERRLPRAKPSRPVPNKASVIGSGIGSFTSMSFTYRPDTQL